MLLLWTCINLHGNKSVSDRQLIYSFCTEIIETEVLISTASIVSVHTTKCIVLKCSSFNRLRKNPKTGFQSCSSQELYACLLERVAWVTRCIRIHIDVVVVQLCLFCAMLYAVRSLFVIIKRDDAVATNASVAVVFDVVSYSPSVVDIISVHFVLINMFTISTIVLFPYFFVNCCCYCTCIQYFALPNCLTSFIIFFC